MNPPYGERLGEKDERLENLYYMLGENLKQNFKGSIFYLITSERNFIKKIQLKTSKKMTLWNGSLGVDWFGTIYSKYSVSFIAKLGLENLIIAPLFTTFSSCLPDFEKK